MPHSSQKRVLENEAATHALAFELAAGARPPLLIALWGDLGAGKTAFARAFIRAVTGDSGLEVPSPTFTLVQTYDSARGVVAHFDLYRLKSAEEAEEIGFYDALAASIVLAEWPERLGSRLPGRRIDIRLSQSPGSAIRTAEIDALP